MLKIQSINLNSIRPNIQNFQAESNSKSMPQSVSISPDAVLNYLSKSNSFISFKGVGYQKTLDENYFQLKSGNVPDVFQKAAAQNLYLGNDVLVSAPTGTGKTAIAYYIITKNLNEGKKTFYTAPLKALSNEKYKEFQEKFGKENVGILTGDVKQNIHAPIVLMTTEIYRNMAFGNKFKEKNNMLSDLNTVIFDELHYLGDVDRGGIWEQSLVLSDPAIQTLSLSATVGNKKDIANWMASIKNQDMEIVALNQNDEYAANADTPIHTVLIDVPAESRHVPLDIQNKMVDAREQDFTQKITFKIGLKEPEVEKLTDKQNAMPSLDAFVKVINDLKSEDKIPAILFIFSKKGCRTVMEHLAQYAPKLTNEKDEAAIKDTINKYVRNGKYLGESLNKEAMLKGYAMHNSGLLPAQKELIEELFKEKLIKVVLSTETLSAGINMPARTTVITATRKPTDTPDAADGKRYISPNEFHQMAGRAGRRGIDDHGFCYSLSVNEAQEQKFAELKETESNDLKSAFRPDYSFIASYYDNCSSDAYLKQVFDKSFFAYDDEPEIHDDKVCRMLNKAEKQKTVLKKLNYMNSDNGLTIKGKMLAKLNGYEQIPVIELISNKAFRDLRPVEFAAAVSALAYIQPKTEIKTDDKDDRRKPFVFKSDNDILNQFVKNTDTFIDKFNNDMKKIDKKYKKVEVNKEPVSHVYEWAKLNYIYSKDSRKNWSELYFGSNRNTIRDEGTVFKEIMMTIDLLKQMSGIVDVAYENSKNKDDKLYYSKMKNTIKEALHILAKEPIDSNIIGG